MDCWLAGGAGVVTTRENGEPWNDEDFCLVEFEIAYCAT